MQVVQQTLEEIAMRDSRHFKLSLESSIGQYLPGPFERIISLGCGRATDALGTLQYLGVPQKGSAYVGIDVAAQSVVDATTLFSQQALCEKLAPNSVRFLCNDGADQYNKGDAKVVPPHPPSHYGTVVLVRHPHIFRDYNSWMAMMRRISWSDVYVITTTFTLQEHLQIRNLLNYSDIQRIHEQQNPLAIPMPKSGPSFARDHYICLAKTNPPKN